MGIITILLRRCDRSPVLDHGGGSGGSVFHQFLIDRGVDTDVRLSETKVIQFDTIRQGFSISWRPILGVIVAERSGSLEEPHQLDCKQTPKAETHGFWSLWLGLPRPGTSVGGLVLSVQTLFPSDGWQNHLSRDGQLLQPDWSKVNPDLVPI